MNKNKIPHVMVAVRAAMVMEYGKELINLAITPYCLSCVHCAHSTANVICKILTKFRVDPTQVTLDSGEAIFHKVRFGSKKVGKIMYDWHPCKKCSAASCKKPEIILAGIEKALWRNVDFNLSFVMPPKFLGGVDDSQNGHRESVHDFQCA